MGTHVSTGPRRRTVVVGVVLSAAVALGGSTAAVAAAQEAPASSLVPGTPCTSTARACADLSGRTAWLIQDGQVVRGPVPISIGGTETTTPTGTFEVEWKDKDHLSKEFDNAPMPYSVFFAPGGIAFHEGSLQTTSAGCVRLAHDDAAAFYDFLQVGDEVQVR